MATILETPRLLLREIEESEVDLAFVAAMLADPEVMSFWPHPMNGREAAEWVERQRGRYAYHGIGYWLAETRATGELVGQYGLLPPNDDLVAQGIDAPNLGYLTHRPYWRKGYAAEACAACRAHAFGALDLPLIYCLIRPENAPSLAVARALGLTLEEGRLVVLAGLDHKVFSARRDG